MRTRKSSATDLLGPDMAKERALCSPLTTRDLNRESGPRSFSQNAGRDVKREGQADETGRGQVGRSGRRLRRAGRSEWSRDARHAKHGTRLAHRSHPRTPKCAYSEDFKC